MGGDVPDTNYLFMGMMACWWHLSAMTDIEQVTSLTVASIHWSPSCFFSASKYATQIALRSFAAITNHGRLRLYMDFTMNAYASMAALTSGGMCPYISNPIATV